MKNKKILYGILIVFVFLMSVGLTYAYFSVTTNIEGDSTDMTVNTASLKLDYKSGPQIVAVDLFPTDTITKSFTVKNIGTLPVEYTVNMTEMVNTIEREELKYNLECKSYSTYISKDNEGNVESGECEGITSQSFLYSQNQTLIGNVAIDQNITHEYTLQIIFIETGEDQNYNQGKQFSGVIKIDEYSYVPTDLPVIRSASINDLRLIATAEDELGITSYSITPSTATEPGEWINVAVSRDLEIEESVMDYARKLWVKNVKGNYVYQDLKPTPKLIVYPNGGTWDESTGNQEINMEYRDTLNIEDPTRSGYTFDGWTLTGEESTLINKVFTMGIENSTLTAQWTANNYTLTVDPAGGTWESSTIVQTRTVAYDSTYNVENPTRNLYTFTGWAITNNTNCTLSTRELTMGLDGCTLTATWEVNEFPWIAYHRKQNVDGAGYTLVDGDTEEGMQTPGLTVTPTVKTYNGFTSPSSQTITIVEDTTPPIHNVVNYNYTRNQYNLTIDPNGGTYNGVTTPTELSKYYESETTIETPLRTGYNLSNWTKSGSGTLVNNILTQGVGVTSLSANWSGIQSTVTFNVNGGAALTSSTCGTGNTFSGGSCSKTVTYGETYGTLPAPTRTSYTFDGWYTSSTGGTKVISTSTVTTTSNQTLYARWVKFSVQYTGGPQISLTNPNVGDSTTKTFAVTNNPTLESYYQINWEEFDNEITKDELVVSFTCTSYSTYLGEDNAGNVVSGKCDNMTEEAAYDRDLKSNIKIAAGYTHVYNLTTKFLNINVPQAYNNGKSFTGTLKIEEDSPSWIESCEGNNSLRCRIITDNIPAGQTEITTDDVASTYVTPSDGIYFRSGFTESNGLGLYRNTKGGDGNNYYFRGGNYCTYWDHLDEDYSGSKCIESGGTWSYNKCSLDYDETTCRTKGFRYYRLNNNVSFAGFMWKILRVDDEGNVRLLYNGTSTTARGPSTQIGAAVYNTKYRDNAYLGYMQPDNQPATDVPFTTTKEQAERNEINSPIKTVVDNWYRDNIANKPSSVTSKISMSSGYCNDRRVSTLNGGIGNNESTYLSRYRVYNTLVPSFKCPHESNDLFTTSSATKGNKKLTYPVALITADELSCAGSSWYSGNFRVFIYSGYAYWTLSPAYYSSDGATPAYLFPYNYFSINPTNTSASGRAVISLNSTAIVGSGDGTYEHPYVIQ